MASRSEPRRGQSVPPQTHVEDGLEIPDHLGSGVTFDQKKRLARLAKMGIGPVAKTPQPPIRERHGMLGAAPTAGSLALLPQAQADWDVREERERRERRAGLLEQERRLRQQEERRQQEDDEAREVRERRAPPRAGLASLGPVQPREEKLAGPKNFPTPAASLPTPAPAAAPAKMEIKISADTAERVLASSSSSVPEGRGERRRFRESAGADEDADGIDDDEPATAAEVLASLRAEKGSEVQEKRKKKKRKRGGRKDDSQDEDAEEGLSEDELAPPERPAAQKQKQHQRDGGISWKVMSVESVKGKVSNDNKRMTDADLERRFGTRDSEPTPGMMTEAQVLEMLQREKETKKGDPGAAQRRAQRELAEWTNIKAQKMARTGPDEKERLVVSRR